MLLEWDSFWILSSCMEHERTERKKSTIGDKRAFSRLQVLGLINNRSCSKSGDAFKLCLLVLDAIAGQLRPALQLAVDQKKEAPEKLRSVGA
ncbi:MAG: hypothetical protein IPK68_10365 [Bdellovibrionales bacterium]|nr:hypothetical protein [Bdellovibrionales bacterium]